MTRSLRIVLLSAAGILLLSLLCYPYGYDQSVFTVGGELMLRHGAVPFRDFMDTKPPLIFIIYGLASLLFGHHEWSIRAFDILYHLASLFCLYKIFKRTLGDEKLAFASIPMYVFLYALSGFWWTSQAESFALLPSILLYDATERAFSGESTVRNGFIAGILTLILFLLKPTLIAVAPAAIIYVLFYRSSPHRYSKAQYLAAMALGSSLILGVFLFYLYSTGALTNAGLWLSWVRGYSNIQSQSFTEDIYKSFPIGLVASFGLSTICIGGIGGYLLSKQGDRRAPTYAHLLLQLVFGFGFIILERKFFPYQYVRIFWAATPFICIGVLELAKRWKTLFFEYTKNVGGWLRIAVMAFVLAAIAFYSLVPRFFSQPLHWTMLRLQGKDIAADVDTHFPKSFYSEEKQVAGFLIPRLQSKDNIFLWGNSVDLYFLVDRYYPVFGLTNTPLVTPWTPTEWREQLLDSLKHSPPRFFICEFFDDRSYITGSPLDSWGHLQQWKALDAFVAETYRPPDTIGHFYVFERKNPTAL